MESKIQYLSEQFQKENITLNELQKRQLYTFYEMLVEKNKVMNLTGITEYEEVVEKHFIDSALLCQVVDLDRPVKIMDLGTGAGFPGLPLKIVFPKIEITLADSLNKRIKFINEVIEELHLDGIYTVHGRAEELARKKEYRETFDYCVSRAVANLSTLEEYCLPFVKLNGTFISYKSGEVDSEVSASEKACKVLGGKKPQVHKFMINGIESLNRSFVMIEKVKSTPKQYPRKAGTPSKEPIV